MHAPTESKPLRIPTRHRQRLNLLEQLYRSGVEEPCTRELGECTSCGENIMFEVELLLLL
jgi:hypothetical protein